MTARKSIGHNPSSFPSITGNSDPREVSSRGPKIQTETLPRPGVDLFSNASPLCVRLPGRQLCVGLSKRFPKLH